LTKILEPIRGRALVQHHPSMNYFFARYGLRSIGSVEESPGQEATPRDLQRLAEAMRVEGVRAVVTEPQLPRAPVDALAEMTGANVVELDPVGGVPGRATYDELMRFNARALVEALK
jgi:ABC-type Zn uptake system ZnuABC Zn-binding protein ZnuA